MNLTNKLGRNIADTIREPFLILDSDLCVASANRNFYHKFHVTPKETIGRLLYQLGNGQWNIAELQNLLVQIISCDTTIESYEVEHEFQKIGRKIISLNARKIVHDGNDLKQILLVFDDITSRKTSIRNLEIERDFADVCNKAKSRFLANMSHDIRTPMNAILGMGEILKASNLSLEQSKALSVMTNAGNNLLALINDILDLSKVEAGQMKIESVGFDLHELVEEVRYTLIQKAHTRGVAFDLSIQPSCRRQVVGDPNRLRQVLINLLDNAIKFTEQGTVSLKVKVQDKELIRFTVSDSGIGITKDQLQHIFDPFRQAEDSTYGTFGGTGLGLSICTHLVRAMKGEISVESAVGKGSTFTFTAYLPKSINLVSDKIPDAHVLEESKSVVHQHAKGTFFNILLADDTVDNRIVVNAFLKDPRYRITEAVDGEEALKAFKSGSFDLVLMDIRMPVLDGYGAIKQIRAWEKEQGLPRTPIVALTADAMRGDFKKTKASDFDIHLSKPISKGRLWEVVASFDQLTHSLSSSVVVNDPVSCKIFPASKSVEIEAQNEPREFPTIDKKAIEQFKMDMGQDAIKIVDDFIKGLPSRVKNIQKEIDDGNIKGIQIKAHNIKGTGRQFGITTLSHLCQLLEEAASADNMIEASRLMIQIKQEIKLAKRVFKILKAEASNKAEAPYEKKRQQNVR